MLISVNKSLKCTPNCLAVNDQWHKGVAPPSDKWFHFIYIIIFFLATPKYHSSRQCPQPSNCLAPLSATVTSAAVAAERKVHFLPIGPTSLDLGTRHKAPTPVPNANCVLLTRSKFRGAYQFATKPKIQTGVRFIVRFCGLCVLIIIRMKCRRSFFTMPRRSPSSPLAPSFGSWLSAPPRCWCGRWPEFSDPRSPPPGASTVFWPPSAHNVNFLYFILCSYVYRIMNPQNHRVEAYFSPSDAVLISSIYNILNPFFTNQRTSTTDNRIFHLLLSSSKICCSPQRNGAPEILPRTF